MNKPSYEKPRLIDLKKNDALIGLGDRCHGGPEKNPVSQCGGGSNKNW